MKKYNIIGLTYNDITSNDLYQNIKKQDTEDDWTYYYSNEELKRNMDYFIESNKYFNSKFIEYKIAAYDVSFNREKILNDIVNSL
ncbi:MAG: hypothetical protein PHD02_03670 [Bacilli bacterium]|nr:hypothetical protein [Bacilli bacterium]